MRSFENRWGYPDRGRNSLFMDIGIGNISAKPKVSEAESGAGLQIEVR
jgi:hypothetical protein